MRIGLRHFFAATWTTLNAYSVPARGIGCGLRLALMQEAQTGARGKASLPQAAQRPPISVARPDESTSSASPHKNGRVVVEGAAASAISAYIAGLPMLCTTELARA